MGDDCNVMYNITTTKKITTAADYIGGDEEDDDEDDDEDYDYEGGEDKKEIINVKDLLPVFDDDEDNAPGVIVMGMHRSGTSMLTGLLSKVFHWIVPGEQVYANITSQNPLGFFENRDIARQNDAWMNEQTMTWDKISMYTDESKSSIVHGGFDFEQVQNDNFKLGPHGRDAMLAYNTKAHRPWAMKDPRACLTLPLWVKLLHGEQGTTTTTHKKNVPLPPILFTYRNPLDVVKSLYSRKRNPVPMLHGFKLWIWYNREAIRLSNSMCRVITSNDALLTNSKREIKRIEEGMKECGLRAVVTPNYTRVDEFIHSEFQQGTKHGSDGTKNVACDIPSYVTSTPNTTDAQLHVRDMEELYYTKAMMVFCDMKSGKAFTSDYVWPT